MNPTTHPETRRAATAASLPASRPGRTVAVGVLAVAIVGVATFLSILFGGGKGKGAGEGKGPGEGTGANPNSTVAQMTDGTARPAAQTLPAVPAVVTPAEPKRPLKVTVRGSSYVVDGREIDLKAVNDLVKQVPAGDGPAVVIVPEGSARAKAEEDLKQSLTDAGVRYAMEE
jgi:hypothetical protein